MAATIMLRILGATFITSTSRGRYVTGTVASDGTVSMDVSRTSKWAEACKRASAHSSGYVHDTHTGITLTNGRWWDVCNCPTSRPCDGIPGKACPNK